MMTPNFWQSKTILSFLLYPFSMLYYLGFLCRKFLSSEYKGNIKILCIGNVTAGGGGKTPTALKIGSILKEKNIKFAYLSKGYGGFIRDFTKVDLKTHSAAEVGDEPLLLAEVADTYICRSRKIAVETLSNGQYDYDLIVMDDGFQNPTIFKDKNLVVVNGENGFGNGFLIPAGPMRETFTEVIGRCKNYLIIGQDKQNIQESLINNGARVFRGHILEKNKLSGEHKYFAFSGLANNEKFMASLKNAGYNVVNHVEFGDHHKYTDEEVSIMVEDAKKNNAKMITTKKDWIKLSKENQESIEFLDIELVFYNDEEFMEFLLND